jgi:hypothetical protein
MEMVNWDLLHMLGPTDSKPARRDKDNGRERETRPTTPQQKQRHRGKRKTTQPAKADIKLANVATGGGGKDKGGRFNALVRSAWNSTMRSVHCDDNMSGATISCNNRLLSSNMANRNFSSTIILDIVCNAMNTIRKEVCPALRMAHHPRTLLALHRRNESLAQTAFGWLRWRTTCTTEPWNI